MKLFKRNGASFDDIVLVHKFCIFFLFIFTSSLFRNIQLNMILNSSQSTIYSNNRMCNKSTFFFICLPKYLKLYIWINYISHHCFEWKIRPYRCGSFVFQSKLVQTDEHTIFSIFDYRFWGRGRDGCRLKQRVRKLWAGR